VIAVSCRLQASDRGGRDGWPIHAQRGIMNKNRDIGVCVCGWSGVRHPGSCDRQGVVGTVVGVERKIGTQERGGVRYIGWS